MSASKVLYGALARMGVPRLRRQRSEDAVVFCFHNITTQPPNEVKGDLSLHVTRDDFISFLSWIDAHYTLIPLREIASRMRAGKSLRGTAALTFDDAYDGVIANAVPALKASGLPATIFVVTEFATSPEPFWWDLLGAANKLSPAIRMEALTRYRGDRRRILEAFPPGDTALSPDSISASWGDVIAACGDGIDVGSHSVSHRNLAALSDAELQAELCDSRDAIEARLGFVPHLIAYPYGLHNQPVLKAAAAAGYTCGVTTAFGRVGPGTDALAMPRINVPAGIGQAALECWAAGLRLRRES